MSVYGTIIRKPYTTPITVKRATREELLKDFPDVKIIEDEYKNTAQTGRY